NRKFEWYLNGNRIEPKEKVDFALNPYFATVRLAAHQQCYLNLGQSPFAYPPEHVRFTDFHTAAKGDARRYRMVTPVEYTNWLYNTWFKLPVFDNHFELCFQDQEQHKWDELIIRFECEVHSNYAISKDWHKESHTQNKIARLTQSI